MPDLPPLKLPHGQDSLVESELAALRNLPTENLVSSLAPGTPGALRVKPDGTVMNGNHRVTVLRARGVDVDALPREVLDS